MNREIPPGGLSTSLRPAPDLLSGLLTLPPHELPIAFTIIRFTDASWVSLGVYMGILWCIYGYLMVYLWVS